MVVCLFKDMLNEALSLSGQEAITMNDYIDRIRQLVLSVLADEEADVYLFGSWARGTARHGSDVDVAVESIPHLT